MMFRSSIALLAILSLSLCSAHIGGSLMLQELDSHVYCGRNLARALADICSVEGTEKKMDGIMYGSILTPYNKEQDIGWPWQTAHKAKGLAHPHGKRLIGGIVDECCYKSCSLDEMLNYCN